jgi:hypothetical protein
MTAPQAYHATPADLPTGTPNGRRRWLLGGAVGAALLLLAAGVVLLAPLALKQLSGQGGRQRAVAGFTSVDVHTAGRLTIRRGDSFGVDVSADDNLLRFIKTSRDGSALRILLDTAGEEPPLDNPPEITVTMPALEAVSLDAGSTALVEGFEQAREFQAVLVGRSTLTGKICADAVDIFASDSDANFSGSGKAVKLKAIGNSHFRLAEFTAEDATIDMLGPCEIEVRVAEHLDYTLIGAAHLEYRGSPAIGKTMTLGPARITQAPP